MSVRVVKIFTCSICEKEHEGIPYGWFVLAKRTSAYPSGRGVANPAIKDACSLTCLIKAETNTPATYVEAQRIIRKLTS